MWPNSSTNTRFTTCSNKTTLKWTRTPEPLLFVLQKCFWWINTRSVNRELVDLWAAGCILYTMLSGYQPFYSKYVSDLIDLIKQGKYDFNSEIWSEISSSAKNLIKRLLQTDSQKRLNAMNSLKHNWFSHDFQCDSDRKVNNQFKTNLIQNQRRLTRHFILPELSLSKLKLPELSLSKLKSSTNSFNRACRHSLVFKDLDVDDHSYE